MFNRILSSKLAQLAQGFPCVMITGPRQSGKTTLVQQVFSHHSYVSLENPSELDLALQDPLGFLNKYPPPCIFDEIQKAPLLLSYMQERMDRDNKPGQWILTGSQQFLLMNQISQTLAGRVAITHLHPLSMSELTGVKSVDPQTALAMTELPTRPRQSRNEMIFSGFYPRVHQAGLDPRDFYPSYTTTYIERDVRDVLKIGDLATFRRFIKLCAGRSGQLLNYSSLAADAGISPPTARAWISILEASSLVVLLPPHFKNFNKRIVKMSKLYFLDTGLLCSLLDLRSAADIDLHPLKGAIFETFVVSGLWKLFCHFGENPPLYFWRDYTGHEIDVVVDLGKELFPLEIKSGETLLSNHFETLLWWQKLQPKGLASGALCYGGDESYTRQSIVVHPWWQF